MPVSGSLFASFVVPVAPQGQRLLEDLEVLILCSQSTRVCVSGARVGPHPLEDLQVPIRGCIRLRPLVPGAPLGPRPL